MDVNNEVEPQLKETTGSKQCMAATGSPPHFTLDLLGVGKVWREGKISCFACVAPALPVMTALRQ